MHKRLEEKSMKVRICRGNIKPSTIVMPSSKSQAHRYLICAALAQGISVIDSVDFNEDISATINGLKQLGATIEIQGSKVIVEGISMLENIHPAIIDCNNSGSTLRFLIPLFAQTKELVQFKGSKRLLERPLQVYDTLFKEMGCYFFSDSEKVEVKGPLKAGEYVVDGGLSSQFISGLLFVLPLLEQESVIKVDGVFESRSYVNMTISVMKEFGVMVEELQDGSYHIAGNQKYRASHRVVEGDFSQFAFFAALGCFRGPLDCLNLPSETAQGDKVIIDYLTQMGAQIQRIENGYRILPATLVGQKLDLQDCPDLGPILSIVASLAHGKSELVNIARLRLKESDRVLAMETELKKCGVQVSVSANSMTVHAADDWNVKEELEGYQDHRIVMALIIGALCADKEIVIGPEAAINKSFPTFLKEVEKLGIKIERVGE